MLFKNKNHRNIFLGVLAVVAIGAAVFGGDLVNLQGRTRLKDKIQTSQQSATSSSIQGAIKISTLGSTSQTLDLTYTFGIHGVKVYSFEVQNNYTSEIKIHKLTAEYSQEGWDDTRFRSSPGFTLWDSRGNYITEAVAGDYGHIPFIFDSPKSIGAGSKTTFWIQADLVEDPEAFNHRDKNMINVWLQEDTLGTVGVGPKYGWSYDEVDSTGSWNIFSTNGSFYFNSAYPDNSNQAVNALPTAVVRTSCGEAQGCDVDGSEN